MKAGPNTNRDPAARQREPRARRGLVWALCLLTLLVVGVMVYLRPSAHDSARVGEAVLPTPVRTPVAVVEASNAPPASLPPPVAAAPLPLRLGPTNPPAAELIANLLNGDLPLKGRREAGRALARLGSDEAIAALKIALRDGPRYLKAAICEGLGESAHPEAKALLLGMLKVGDPITARGAIRGFALRGDTEAVDILGGVLFDAHQPESLRTESALSLGDIRQPQALAALTRAASEITAPTIAESVLDGLGRRPIAETAEFFRGYVETPGRPADLKVAALEAIGNAEGDPAPFLLTYGSNPNPELRAAAAWALNMAETATDIGPQLLDWLKQESKPEVRARLYRALGNQDTYDASAVIALAQRESAPAARLAGFDLLAETCRSAPTPEVLGYFNQTALPELKTTALTSESPEHRLSAVMALQRAGTTLTEGALQDIARSATDPKVIAAAQAALGSRSANP